MAAVVLAGLVLALAIGVLPLGWPVQLTLLGLLLFSAAVVLRHRRRGLLVVALLLPLLIDKEIDKVYNKLEMY